MRYKGVYQMEATNKDVWFVEHPSAEWLSPQVPIPEALLELLDDEETTEEANGRV